MKLRQLIGALGACAAWLAAPAAPALAAQERLFIAPLDAEGLTRVEERIVTERLVSRVVAYQAFELISEQAVNSIIEQTRQQYMLEGGCLGDDKCLNSLGRLLRSRFILRSRAFVVEDEITITVEFVDIEGGRILSKREYRTVRPMRSLGPDFEVMMDDVMKPLKLTGQLRVTAEVADSVLIVQKRQVRVNAENKAALTLPIGSYGLELTHPAYLPVNERLLVPATGADWAPDQVSLEEANPPFYKRWWFWAGVAVVGTSAGAGIYYAVQPEEEKPVVRQKRPYGTVTVRF